MLSEEIILNDYSSACKIERSSKNHASCGHLSTFTYRNIVSVRAIARSLLWVFWSIIPRGGLFIILLLISCSHQSVVELPLPAPLVLEGVPSESLECLSDEAYKQLVDRDIALQQRINTLREIIQSTH